MRLVLSLLALCLTWNSFGSAADPVVCVPISAAQGPANSAGITPINCQIVANKTIIACYPTYQVNFPQQFPTRVSCTPMEPTTTTSTTTSTTTTTVTSTTVTPSTTEESSFDFVLCLPIRSCGCGSNGQGVDVIICFLVDIEIEIRCYPRFIDFIFGQNTPIECLPLDEITTTESTTEEPTTPSTAMATTEESSLEFVECLPIRTCGCGSNDQGIEVIICFIVDIEIEIRCYPRFIDFVFGQNTPIECLPLDEITTTESTTEEPTTTELAETEEAVICVPYAEIEDAESNENGIKPIYCMLISNHTIIICYPQTTFIFYAGPISQRILCVPAALEVSPAPSTAVAESSTTSSEVTCIPISPCGCGVNEDGVEAIKCLIIDIEIIVICFPTSSEFTYNNQTIQCVIVEGSSSAPASGETSAETEVATVAPIICVPVSPISYSEPNEEGVYPIQCMTIDHVLIICYPQSQVIFVGPGEIQQRIFCVPIELQETTEISTSEGTTEVATSTEEEPEPVICVPYAPIEDAESNENGVKPIYCMLISNHTIIICCPLEEFIFFPGPISQRIMCVPVPQPALETTTTEVSTATSSDDVLCIPLSPCDGSSEESNEEGVKAIYCIIIDIDIIVKCYPKVIDFIWNQTSPIHCEKIEEVTLPSDSSSEEEETIDCIPFRPCEGSSEESNEDGVDAIFCLIEIDVIVKCFPKFPMGWAFNQTATIECVPVKEVTVSPPTPAESGESGEEEPVICIPFKPCEGSSEESNEEGVDAIYCLIIDIDIIVKCFPKEFGFDFNQTASIECVPVKEVTVSPPTDSGESEAIDCIPMSPCQGSSEESNENGVKAIMCWLIDIEIVVKCFPLIEGWTFNQTATIKCLPVEETTTTEIEEESSSTVTSAEPVFCIPFSPCDGSNEEEEKNTPIMCWIVEINILIKCYPMVIDWTFNQTSTIECTPCEETTETTSATEIIETSTPESDVVFCIPFAPCGAETKVIQCLLIELDIIIICHPTTFDFAYNQTLTIECLLIEENPTTSETEETSVTEETATSEKYVPNVIDCHPLGPCGCGLVNEDNTEAIICEILYWGHIITCFPQTEDFVFNQTYTVPCQMIYPTAETQTTSEPSEEVECIPLGPVENGESGLIQCKLIDEETVIECYPVTFNGFSTGVPSGSGETSSIASTTVGSIKCVPKLQGTTASAATTTTP